MEIDSTLIKSFAKQSLKVVTLILFLTCFGVMLNWILLAFLTPELATLFDASAGRVVHAGGPVIVLALILLIFFNWQASLLFLTFFLVFPILHFLFAKKYAISNAIQSLIAERKTQFVEYLFEKFFLKLKSKSEIFDGANPTRAIQVINEHLPTYIKKLEGMPFAIRMILKFFLSKMDIMGIVSNAINEQGQVAISQKDFISKISNKVNEELDERVFSPSFSSNGILLLLNFASFTLIKVFI